VHAIGHEIGDRAQGERPEVKAGMRYLQALFVHHLIAQQQNVDVDGTWRVA